MYFDTCVTDVIFNVFLRCTYSLFIDEPYFCVTELIVAQNTGMFAFVRTVTSVFTFENERRYIMCIKPVKYGLLKYVCVTEWLTGQFD